MSTQTIEQLRSPYERALLHNVKRRVAEEFPDLGRELLSNPLKRNMFENMLISLLKHANEPTLEQCIVRVQKHGYSVMRGTGSESRQTGTFKAVDADNKIGINRNSQRHRMLNAWFDAGDVGLTSEEARRASSLSPTSCYWARATELMQGGYIEIVEDLGGEPVRRQGESGTARKVYRITPLGSETVQELL